MISLPGLCLTTGRLALAREILIAFSGYVSYGMIPNRFPDHGEIPEYNTADATLLFHPTPATATFWQSAKTARF